MTIPNNPTEIAREAFRQLATRRVPPTPDNYRMLYAEISGQASDGEAFPEKELKRLAHELGQAAPGQSRLERDLAEVITRQDWEGVRRTLASGFGALAEAQQLAWSRLIGELFRQWENKSADITPGKKREALDRALAIFANNPRALFTRLENLQRAWARGEVANDIALTDADLPESEAASAPEAAPVGDRMAVLPELRELFAYTLENCIAPLLVEQPRFSSEATALAQAVRKANTLSQLATMQSTLKQFAFRLELSIEDQAELRASLLKLLRLVIENIGELLQEDQWLAGQIEIVRDIVEKPLSQRALDDAEQRMKEVIFKQSQLKLGLQEAKDALKHMLTGFVDHLASFAGATSDYHDAIEQCARRVSAANNINELESVLAEVMQKTRAIQLNAQQSRDELRATQEKATVAEGRVKALEKELAQTSHLIRHDQLTGALNRRGLDEVLGKESARAERHELPICLSLLDIDVFKRLNDRHGHVAGDEALAHLATVIRESLRPQDTVARFGGEDFVIIFPETDLKEAVSAMTRLQRNLTRRIFLYENQKVLITFSAGIAQLQAGESQSSVTRRADAAMYESKKAGKNRVMVAAA
ncbi:MAG: GGDEF domain-containing protein [Zoogloeaceae bacterium]|jgi:diguanylate cyclase|nr:GGDEF domain-containing protein [Zoogloeaceae bacterium]